MTKSIFEKAYITEKQCEAAIAKAFGDDAINYIAKKGEDRKWRVLEIPMVEPKANVTLEEALKESGETLEDLKDDGHMSAQADADRLANASMGVDPLKPRFSTCERPTKKVWHIADSMPGASRKAVMEECVRQGIAYGTARTQYQAWFKASQECMPDLIRKPYQKGTDQA